MKRGLRGVVALATLVLSNCIVPASAQFGGGLGGGGFGGGLGGGQTYSLQGPFTARARQEQLRRQLDALTLRLERARQKFETGSGSRDEMDALAPQVEQMREYVASMQEQVERESVLDRLQRPVNLTLKDATIRQAADALGKASRLPIEVNERVPQDQRISVDVARVSLARVLQVIAGQTNLMLAPMGTPWTGVEIAPWPTLTVGGQRQQFLGSYAPWSDEWGGTLTGDVTLNPVAASAATPLAPTPAIGALPGQPQLAPTPTTVEGNAPSPFGGGGFGGGLGGGGGMMGSMSPMTPFGIAMPPSPPIALTSPSPTMLVVAEPGQKDGAPGVYLTVYRIEGGQLRRTGSLFHRFTGAQPGSMMPGMMPGMPDGRGGIMGARSGPGLGGFGGVGGERLPSPATAPVKPKAGSAPRKRGQSPPSTAPGAEAADPAEGASNAPPTAPAIGSKF